MSHDQYRDRTLVLWGFAMLIACQERPAPQPAAPPDPQLQAAYNRAKSELDDERKASMVGSDATTDVAMAVHEGVTLEHGIFNLEWMRFGDLLADRAYEFLFVFTPLRLKGATGSPGWPIAIR